MSIITIIQSIVALGLITLILIQERSSGSSGLFGGGSEGGFYQARRGIEKTIFIATLVLLGLFAILSLVNLL